MSYGWLTESTLMPKAGKTIQLPSSSLNSLNAVIYDNEQSIKQRKDGKSYRSKTRRLMSATSRSNELLKGKNLGVENRQQVDEAYYKANKKTEVNVKKKLEEKAKLYEAIVSGNASSKITSSTVDFSKKIREEGFKQTFLTEDKDIDHMDTASIFQAMNASNKVFLNPSKVAEASDASDTAIAEMERKEFLIQITKETDNKREEVAINQRARRQHLRDRLIQLRLEKNNILSVAPLCT